MKNQKFDGVSPIADAAEFKVAWNATVGGWKAVVARAIVGKVSKDDVLAVVTAGYEGDALSKRTNRYGLVYDWGRKALDGMPKPPAGDYWKGIWTTNALTAVFEGCGCGLGVSKGTHDRITGAAKPPVKGAETPPENGAETPPAEPLDTPADLIEKYLVTCRRGGIDPRPMLENTLAAIGAAERKLAANE